MEKRKGRLDREVGSIERERKVAELLPAVHRLGQEQTLARLFFFVLLIIISPKRQSTHHTLE